MSQIKYGMFLIMFFSPSHSLFALKLPGMLTTSPCPDSALLKYTHLWDGGHAPAVAVAVAISLMMSLRFLANSL